MRYATGGTVLACRLALEHGVAVNLGGGFHHASADKGGGFSVYADVPLAVKMLHDEGKIGTVLVVDLDAHQGNGTAATFRSWSWAKILDLYEEDIYPIPKEPEDFPLAVGPGLTGGDYNDMVNVALVDALDTVRPDLVVYNAGSDPFIDDPLTSYRLTKADLTERDLNVVSLVRERSIPVAMVLSGGYSGESWRVHTDAIEDILVRYDKVS
jgi:histone deacetylase 11